VSPTGALEYRDYLRLDMMPHILCPGCGHGIVLKAILRAIQGLGLPREQVVFVSGIGCSSRLVGYVDFATLHTTHGRPLTFATGLKLARPELHVIVITGDGDGLAIGGNHLIHAARRNVDLTCLLLNNAIYGMTGGQGAPTTPPGARSAIAADGSIEPAFDACRLAQGAGATFVGRGMTAAPLGLDDLIARALTHRGFSFLEILSDCPEYFGRYNALGRGPEMLEAQRRHVDAVDEALGAKRFVEGLATPPAGTVPPFETGVLHQEARPELTERLRALAAHRRAAAADGSSAPREARHSRGEPGCVEAPPADGEPVVPRSQSGVETTGRDGTGGEYCIRVAGAGGQGIVLAGLILAEAAVVAGKNATHAQAYGPESRGGSSKADVIVSDAEIDYPYAERADVLVALTQDAVDRHAAQLAPGGFVLVDADRVRGPAWLPCRALSISGTAERVLGTAVGANLVALGALVALADVVPPDAVRRVIARRRPGGDADRALRAFEAGLEVGAGVAGTVESSGPPSQV
jgi:2-oxoglutarate ferredoxin oxidoreductase subunit beta